jgi:Cu-Zn family superoxide dismutase
MHKSFLTLLVAGLAGCASLGGSGPQATATLTPTAGNAVSGTVTFSREGDDVLVVADVTGLKPNQRHGFHIHEKGDCSAPDASSAGGHFNPTGAPHGNPGQSAHHAGDMPNLQADDQGRATLRYTLSDVDLGQGERGIVGRAVIVHGGTDDYRSQPAGNSGPRLACGVIRK